MIGDENCKQRNCEIRCNPVFIKYSLCYTIFLKMYHLPILRHVFNSINFCYLLLIIEEKNLTRKYNIVCLNKNSLLKHIFFTIYSFKTILIAYLFILKSDLKNFFDIKKTWNSKLKA